MGTCYSLGKLPGGGWGHPHTACEVESSVGGRGTRGSASLSRPRCQRRTFLCWFGKCLDLCYRKRGKGGEKKKKERGGKIKNDNCLVTEIQQIQEKGEKQNAATIVAPRKVEKGSRTRPATGAHCFLPACPRSGTCRLRGSSLGGPLPFLFCGFPWPRWNQEERKKESGKGHRN